jgi:hypothetical protein
MTSRKPPPPPVGNKISDQRRKFRSLSRKARPDPEAERAFLESKMEIVRTDPSLTPEQRRDALEMLQRKLPPPKRTR